MGICGQEKPKKKTIKKTDNKTETKTETKTENNIETIETKTETIETKIKTIKSELDHCNNNIKNLENSIKEESKNIIRMLEDEKADDNKTKESDNSYPSFDQIFCKIDISNLNNLIKEKRQNKEKSESLQKKKKDLEELLEEIKNKSSKENEQEIEFKYYQIIKKRVSNNKNKNECNFESSLTEITRLFNTFIDQRKIIINEINGISNRKRNFYSEFEQKKYYNFKYPDYLQNDLDEIRKRIENSFINFETKLKQFRKKINDEIKKLLNKQIDLSDNICIKQVNNNNVNLEQEIRNIIDEQIKIDNDSIEEKNKKIENAFIESKKREINSEILNLKNSIEKISSININLVKILQSYQRLNNSINQKEKDSNNRYYFISNEIENKTKNLDIIKNIRKKLKEKIILFRNKNNQVCNIINKYNSLEENIYNKINVCLDKNDYNIMKLNVLMKLEKKKKKHRRKIIIQIKKVFS